MPSGLVRTIELLGYESQVHREYRADACQRIDQKVQSLIQEGHFSKAEVLHAAETICSRAVRQIGTGGETTLFSVNPEKLSEEEERKVKLYSSILRATRQLNPYLKTYESWWGFGSVKRDFVATAPCLTIRRFTRLGLFWNGEFVKEYTPADSF